MNIKYKSNSVEDTIKLANIISTLVNKGSIIRLDGDLGAGKTCFTQALAKALDVNRQVTSPTFNIMKIYEGKFKFYHLDLYRLSEVGFDMDLEEYIYSDGVSVIEWSENVEEIFSNDTLKIKIKVLRDNCREFNISSNNKIYEDLERLL